MSHKFGPMIRAGIVLGAGLGGFLDGILLHQILQSHNMLSARVPPDSIVAIKTNMVWDGYFHAGVWLLTAAGVFLLFRAGARREVAWSGRVLLGALVLGFGLFNLVEGVIDHHWLGLHHVVEAAPPRAQALYDFGFLIFGGVLLIIVGRLLIISGKRAWQADETKEAPPSERAYLT